MNDQSLSASGPFESSDNEPRPPTLHLQTSFDDTSSAFLYDDSTQMETPMDSGSALSVPAIQVTGPHGGMPSSPFLSPNSPSPSLFSGTSRASTPDPFAATAWSMNTGQNLIQTQPMSEWQDVYDANTHLTTPSIGHSRRSSVSSFGGLGPSFCSMDLDGSDWADQSPTEFPPWRQQEPARYVPQRQYAEVLAEHAFTMRRLPLERTAFRVCLEAVYERNSAPAAMLSSLTPYSLRIARCLVFLVLTIGSKLNTGSGEDCSVSNSCYAVVLEEMSSGLDFWAEPGSQEVIGLLSLLPET